MNRTILILLIGFIAFSFATPKFNADFEHILKGEQVPSDHEILKMYQEFLYTFKNTKFAAYKDMDRFAIFKTNVRKMILHNSNPERTWDMGINQMTDLTDEEKLNYYNLMEDQDCSATASPKRIYSNDIPANFSWVDEGVVSPVKDQKNCGSCWTFSTVGVMESRYKMATGEELMFSEQELVDCPDPDVYDTHGCSGGLPSYAYNFIRDFGLEEENDYPYLARDAPCSYDASAHRVTTDGPFNITAGDEEQLKEELFNTGPVSVAFQVVADFMSYTSGVYSSTDCKNTSQDVNHAVVAVGFGTTEDGIDYWLVKNSWSDQWGDEGFFKIQRGVNMCGIAMCNSFPNTVFDA